ncbi:hypothetical protein DICVIV_03413 [Dictyocaulus viviparus]|uniref:Uncharacterized protein n=1 Tax=Dictyocaulus viviparus TaxID=29172 RepID=A0A0D8Y2L0_DICVI|nr:hypothetical protein DICVIV_03413 [Dictyocaulus viviparus]
MRRNPRSSDLSSKAEQVTEKGCIMRGLSLLVFLTLFNSSTFTASTTSSLVITQISVAMLNELHKLANYGRKIFEGNEFVGYFIYYHNGFLVHY